MGGGMQPGFLHSRLQFPWLRSLQRSKLHMKTYFCQLFVSKGGVLPVLSLSMSRNSCCSVPSLGEMTWEVQVYPFPLHAIEFWVIR